jgi:hypothetical protein
MAARRQPPCLHFDFIFVHTNESYISQPGAITEAYQAEFTIEEFKNCEAFSMEQLEGFGKKKMKLHVTTHAS